MGDRSPITALTVHITDLALNEEVDVVAAALEAVIADAMKIPSALATTNKPGTQTLITRNLEILKPPSRMRERTSIIPMAMAHGKEDAVAEDAMAVDIGARLLHHMEDQKVASTFPA